MDCARCETPIEAGDLRCSICALATPVDLTAPVQTRVEVLRCDGCGASVSYDVEVQAPRCAFCGSVMHVEGIEDPMEQTEWFLSFSLDPERARAALSRWLGTRGFFTPNDLVAEATVEHLRPLFWVAWVFEVDALVSWTADSDAGAGRSAWAPHAGQASMRFENILVSASRGLSDQETRALTSSYDLSAGAPRPIGPAAPVVERFDVQRSAARATIVQEIEQVATHRVLKEHVPGRTYRNLSVVALLEGLVTRRCAFPAYVLAYRYRGELYRAVIHGQNEDVIVGATPKSIWKILLVVLGGIAGGLLLIALLVLFASS